LGSGTNTIHNELAGLMITDDDIRLLDTNAPPPAPNLLTNDGAFEIGGLGKLKTTALWGNFVQTSFGSLPLDIDLNTQTTDLMNVTGTAVVGGSGRLLFHSIDQAFTEYTIMTAAGGMTDDNFEPFTNPPAVGFNFMTRVDSLTDLVLFAEKPAFEDLLAGSGVTDPNVFRMGAGLTDIENAIAIDDPFNRLINLLRFQPDEEALGLAIVTLTPSAAPHVFEFAKRRLTSFLDATDECPELPTAAGFYSRRGCIWAAGRYSAYERDDVLGAPETDDEYRAFTVGLHAPVSDAFGIGLGFETGNGSSDKAYNGLHISNTDTEVNQANVTMTYRSGPFGMSLSVGGTRNDFTTRRVVKIDGFEQTYSEYEGIQDTQDQDFIIDEHAIFTDKTIAFDGINGIAVGGSELWAINPRLHLSYAFGKPIFQMTPYVDIDAYFARIDRYEETGVGLANLAFPKVTERLVTVTPGLELSTEMQFSESGFARSFVRAGVALNRSDEWETKTQFRASPNGLSDIRITEPFDAAVAKIDAGIQLMDISGAEVGVTYSGAFSETTTQHDATGSVRFRF
ncbi:autotransporter outer membrane beta-barrel domain-containing protein, partial [Hyphomicrobium sp.]|uniref:autotransporter outer membrane beta-barrel domain-containing protein n=1 Tax=Hyphomicrobium sp. TaxID=82 RepID=UPI0025C2DF1C